MKNALLTMLAALLLAGCDKEPESVTNAGGDFMVGRLFTVDGCTLYRFEDGGRNVYFSDCTGATSYSYQASNGKSSTRRNTEVATSGPKEK